MITCTQFLPSVSTLMLVVLTNVGVGQSPAPIFGPLQTVQTWDLGLTGGALWDVTTADLNNDGFDDIVYTHSSYTSVGVSLSIGGTFSAPSVIYVDPNYSNATRVLAGDVDGDGYADLVLCGDQPLLFFKGIGDGTFASPVYLQGTQNFWTYQTTLGDVDGDGVKEIILLGAPSTGGAGSGPVHLIVLNHASGGAMQVVFDQPIASGMQPVLHQSRALGDVTGDVIPDLVAVEPYGPLYVFPGLGGFSFGTNPEVHALAPSYSTLVIGNGANRYPTVADVDADGREDVIMSVGDGLTTWGSAIWFKQANNGCGLAAIPQVLWPISGLTIYHEDLTANGVLDELELEGYSPGPNCGLFLGGDCTNYTYYLRIGDLVGGYSAPMTMPIGPGPVASWAVAADTPGDADGDGDLDLVMAGYELIPGGGASYKFIKLGLNNTLVASGCVLPSGEKPSLKAPRAWPGSTSFGLFVEASGEPLSPGYLGISVAASVPPTACFAGIDLAAGAGFVVPLPTNAAGSAWLPVPLPSDPTLLGLTFFAQWGVIGTGGLGLSPVRQIPVW